MSGILNYSAFETRHLKVLQRKMTSQLVEWFKGYMPKNPFCFVMLATIGAEKYDCSHRILQAEETSNNVVRQKKLKF
jgi:hypothetical protein